MVAKKEIEEIYSKSVRSGRRTYFFDVRSTRAEDYYLTITESKRDFNEDGTPFYKKHKIYLYKEDFESFQNALAKVSEFIIKEKGSEVISNSKFNKTTSDEKDEVINEAKQILDVEDVVASILLVDNLRIQKN